MRKKRKLFKNQLWRFRQNKISRKSVKERIFNHCQLPMSSKTLRSIVRLR